MRVYLFFKANVFLCFVCVFSLLLFPTNLFVLFSDVLCCISTLRADRMASP